MILSFKKNVKRQKEKTTDFGIKLLNFRSPF